MSTFVNLVIVVFDEKCDISIPFLLLSIVIHYRDCLPLYTSIYTTITINTTIIIIITTIIIIIRDS